MKFKFLILTFLFIFVFNISAYADDYDYSDLSFSMAIKNQEYDTAYNLVLTIDSFSFADDVDLSSLKIYGYQRDTGSFMIVSNEPFSCTLHCLVGSTDYTVDTDSTTSTGTFKRYAFKNGSFSWRTNYYFSAGSLSGYYRAYITGYYEDSSSCSVLSTSNLITSCYDSYLADDSVELVSYIADDFFQCPPTLTATSTTWTGAEILIQILTIVVSLVLLLLGFRILLDIFIRYFRRLGIL